MTSNVQLNSSKKQIKQFRVNEVINVHVNNAGKIRE